MRFLTRYCLAVVLCLLTSLTHAQVTEITLTDDVALENVDHLGLNLGNDNYWSGSVYTKLRSQYNFEGSMYRQLSFGPKPEDGNGYLTWYPPSTDWIEIYRGASFTMVSGPAKGESAKIADVQMQDYDQNGKVRKLPYFKFDRSIKPGKSINEGILIERDLTDVGWFPRRDGFWNSPNVELATDDIDPSTKGKAALLINALNQNAHLRLSTHQDNHGQLAGKWLVRFHGKAKSGKPVVTVNPEGVSGSSNSTPIATQWTVYELPFEVTSVGDDNTRHMMVKLSVNGGNMLIDNVALYDQNSSNPTAFRDDLIALLQKLKPGTLRYLQMGGSTVRNAIVPPLQTFAYQSAMFTVDKQGYGTRVTQDPYSLHDFYVLCEYVNADPWYCLPGTLHPQEVAFFMDYLAGDQSTEGGRLRHELGHLKPWTEVFGKVHVEFGNEAWNIAPHYRMGGFNGADYWKDLIAAGKSSANYKANVIFHAGSQAASPRRSKGIVAQASNADAAAIAPYILHTLNKKELDQMQTPENFYKWALAYPIWRSTDEQGTMVNQYNEVVKNAGKSLSVYEINHHPTEGDAPLAIRNELVDSIGGATNLLNTLLLQMKHQKIKTQCIFTAFGDTKIKAEKGALHIWGTILSMRSGYERYRPTFLAAQMANEAMAGDMIQTTHSNDQPTFTATGLFQARQPAQTVTYPALQSYAFKDGNTCSLIVINLDINQAHPIKLKTSSGNSARRVLLTGEAFTSNNEWATGQPQVKMTEDQARLDQPINVPAHSIMTLTWQQ